MFSKLLLPAFAVLSVAAAQSTACSDPKATFTVNSAADATGLADCETIAGTVLIGSDASGTLDISGPKAISGSLVGYNAPNVNGLSSTSLNSIGLFNLTVMNGLSTINMPALTSVGTINWATANALTVLTFTSGIQKASNITISDTFLKEFPNLNLTTIAKLDLNNNHRLDVFTSTIKSISNSLNVASNGQNTSIQFPNLVWANDMVFRNVSSVMFPSLQTVNASLIFDENHFDSVNAPNLTSVGNKLTRKGSLAYVGNNNLVNISIPGLTAVGGGIQVANNSALQSISFPKLATVGGAVDLAGNFTTPSLPELDDVVGALNLQSTADIDCSGFNKLSGGVVQGKVNCVSKTDDPESLDPSATGGSGTGTGTGSSSKPTKTNGATGTFGISEAAAGLSVVGGLLQMFL